MSKPKEKKPNRLFAMNPTPVAIRAAEKFRFVRITPDYMLVYAPPKKPVGSLEITKKEMHRLTTADEMWLVDCVAALAAESILQDQGEGRKKLGNMIDQLETELKAELDAMKGGGMTDGPE